MINSADLDKVILAIATMIGSIGAIVVSILTVIKDAKEKKKATVNGNRKESSTEVIEVLMRTIDEKDKEIERRQKIIEELHDSLSARRETIRAQVQLIKTYKWIEEKIEK